MTALRTFRSHEASCLYDKIQTAPTSDDLDNLGRQLWQCYGTIGDDDAAFLQSCIDRRRPVAPAKRFEGWSKPIGQAARIGRFVSRQYRGSPDRKASRDRRRMLGGSAILPSQLRHHYTEGQRAVLTIIGGEVKHHGACDLPLDKIAALAGVCRTTVQTAIHEARLLGHVQVIERPRPGRKNLTNVLRIVSAEWLAWLKRGPTAHRPNRVQNNGILNPTKNTIAHGKGAACQADRPQGAIRGVPWARSGPPPMREAG